jgi:tRNA-dihydrouridine synthase A
VQNTTKQGISIEKRSDSIDRRVSVAPMMDWTDRHCRYFLRQFSPQLLLYSEMINASAILRGDRAHLLRHSPEEQPLAVQLGGSDPQQLAAAARIAADAGYVEVNLNCGCPSDRVHAGAFGACLMQQPALVAECVSAMKQAVRIPVTVKFRVGVVDRQRMASAATAREAMQRFDAQDLEALVGFARQIVAAGADALIVHARKAVLGGLSPHENRTVPPLRFDAVTELKHAMTAVPVVVNGGVRTMAEALAALQKFDGVMIGREAYHRPWLLRELQLAMNPATPPLSLELVLANMHDYIAREIRDGARMQTITRHMLGLMSGRPGARELRQLLSQGLPDHAGIDEVFQRASALARDAA